MTGAASAPHSNPGAHAGSAPGSAAGLRIAGLSVDYRDRGGAWRPALADVDLSVEPGAMTAVVGESGSGKTTTAAAVIGLLADNGRISGGSIELGGEELTALRPAQLARVRGTRIGYVPQDPGTSLNPLATIGTAVAETLRIHRLATRAQARERALELLERVGIDSPERRIDQYPHELSGGMRQRALIAAAIAARPELIVADEPTSALDVTVQQRILDLLDELRAEGTGILLITHDLAVAGERADTVAVMQRGRIVESGPAATVLTAPTCDYTRRLLRDAPSLTAFSPDGPPPASPAPEVRGESRPTRASGAVGTASAGRGASAGEGSQAEEPLLRVSGLTQVYARGADGAVAGVDDVSFAVPAGTTHGIVGESGSGKSTIAAVLAGTLVPQAGSAVVAGIDAARVPRTRRRELRRAVQLVHQNPASALDPMWSVGASIAEPLRSFRIGARSERAARVREAMEMVALSPDLAERRPRELSGGQLQRVAIARAFAARPQLIVFDEAVSALDVTVQAQILRLLGSLQAELGLTYVFISHDLAVVRGIAQSVSVLSRGRQVEEGPTARVFDDPQDAYTRRLIAAIPHPLG
ncbi:ABC transporter ATP-binding protein [Brevibacterium sp. BRM-1]|uniref:dipeptide ABC transporter ATP-binding protein n=1 Tax=Brevibacterium sp. BRM-1 TaxID=2999062 RepID=UPI002281EF47|nr:ABC transporter ATP-binding protein [Brevibacterium sp. BRM-1]WAL39426.1 ABC transporter ATP-binding protein [Brevibacterium sp. BRM-1]